MKTSHAQYYQKFDIPDSISNKNLLKIIDFYLFNCPVPGISQRGNKFADYGFCGSAKFSKLKSAMLDHATASLKENYRPCKKSELETAFQQMEKVSPPDEYCAFIQSDEKTVIFSLFSAIRNAFAHGSFNVKAYRRVRIYFFVNHKNYTKAKIILHEDTLLAWIKLIQEGYDALKNNI